MDEAPAHNSTNSSMIDMNDISLALELVKADRAGSTNSLSSWAGTVLVTPDECRSGSSSSSSSSCSSRGNSNDRNDGLRRRKASVRWRDEEGGDLVSEVRRTPDFWEELVFGPQEGGGGGGGSACATEQQQQPSELCMFISELTRGVEATVVFSGLTKKRRRVVLFTDDNGVSLSWLVKNSGSPKQPYRIRCETLLEVKPKFLAARPGAGGGAREEEERCCDIGLKWLPQPTWSKRSAKLVDIATESHAMFASGMVQLLSFNTNIQS